MAAVPPPLVGRARELERLEAALACAPSVVVVEGEAGIGKSRLVAELAARSSRRFLIGGCAQVREPFPLGPIVEALRGRGADVAGAPLSPVAGSLRPLLPELGDVLPEAPPALDDRAAERHRLFRGLAEVLSALGPAVLVVEDLHWADELTVEFLTYLVTVLPHGLSVVLTYRGEEAGAAVRSVTSRAASTVTADSLTLPPLDVAETRALAAAILETEHVSAEFAEHLRSRASGLPLAVQELLALLRSRGTLIRWEGGWARRALESLDVPAGVRASVQERVAHLPPRARAVVEAAAVLRLAVPLSVLAEVADLDEAPGAAGADEALASGLLVERDGLVEFRHTLSAQAAYAAITLGRRQAMHARAATAVGALHPVPYGQIAHHLRGAGRITSWVEATATAADRALALGDDAEAVRLLEDVLRHAPLDPVRRAELSTRLGRAARATGRVRAIGDLLAEALGHDLPRTVRGELRLELALHIDLTRTDQLRVRQAFADAIEDLGDRPELAAWAMVGLGIPTTADRPLAERVAWLERALDTLPQDGDGGLRLFVLGKVAMVFAVAGDPRWSASSGLPGSAETWTRCPRRSPRCSGWTPRAGIPGRRSRRRRGSSRHGSAGTCGRSAYAPCPRRSRRSWRRRTRAGPPTWSAGTAWASGDWTRRSPCRHWRTRADCSPAGRSAGRRRPPSSPRRRPPTRRCPPATRPPWPPSGGPPASSRSAIRRPRSAYGRPSPPTPLSARTGTSTASPGWLAGGDCGPPRPDGAPGRTAGCPRASSRWPGSPLPG